MSPRDAAFLMRDDEIERLLAGLGDADDAVTPVVAALRARRSAPAPSPELAAILAGGPVPVAPVVAEGPRRRVPRTVVALSAAGALMTGAGVAAAQGVLPGPVERAVTHVVNRWTPFHLDEPDTTPANRVPASIPTAPGRPAAPGSVTSHQRQGSPAPAPSASGANGSGAPTRLTRQAGSASRSGAGPGGHRTATSAAPSTSDGSPGRPASSKGSKQSKSGASTSKAAKSRSAPSDHERSEQGRGKAPKSEPPTSKPATSKPTKSQRSKSEGPTSEAPKSEAPKSEAPESASPTSATPTSPPPQPGPSVVVEILGLIVPIR